MNDPIFSFFSNQEHDLPLVKQASSFYKMEQEDRFLFNDGGELFNTEFQFQDFQKEQEESLKPQGWEQIEEAFPIDDNECENNSDFQNKNYELSLICPGEADLGESLCIPQDIFHPKNDESFKAVQKIEQKKISKPKKLREKRNAKSETTKNIHRYMTRQIIRALANEDFVIKTSELCKNADIDYETVKSYYLSKIETFTSIYLLREHWKVKANDNSVENRMKMVFRDFSKWFLKEKAIRYILNGKMKTPLKYIHYKNHIMLFYIDNPEFYKSNNRA